MVIMEYSWITTPSPPRVTSRVGTLEVPTDIQLVSIRKRSIFLTSTSATINTVIVADPGVNHPRIFADNNSGVDVGHIHKTAYPPITFFGIFLGG